MDEDGFGLRRLFSGLHRREEFFERILQSDGASRRILRLYLVLVLLSFCYGVIMGSYHGLLQSLATGVKIPLLLSLTLVICCPAFLVIQLILGSQLRLSQMIAIVLSGFVLTVSIMIAFAPILIFFQLTGGNYHFLILLHLLIWALSGFFGMKTIVDALKFSCEKKSIYPQTGVVVFRFWVVIFAFVGVQLAWNLRPFLGDRQRPFQLFREYEGNFYTAVIYSVRQLTGGEGRGAEPPSEDQRQSRKTLLPFMLEEDREGN
jgi:hypothetical protein